MDFAQSIRVAVDSGKVDLGVKKALKHSLNGGAKMIVIAQNCPAAGELKEYCKNSNLQLVDFEGNGMELGAVCGKPFSVSALSVVEEGNSDVLKAASKQKEAVATKEKAVGAGAGAGKTPGGKEKPSKRRKERERGKELNS